MLEELAKDYSKYMKVDFNPELHNVQDTIDDMLTRLDEFENVVNMVRSEGQFCVDVYIPQILKSKEQLDNICDKIDSLDRFVNRVKADMNIVESLVEEAQSDVGQNSRSLKNIFKPLFFSSRETSGRRVSRNISYEPPILFSTSNYFHSEGEEKEDSSKNTE